MKKIVIFSLLISSSIAFAAKPISAKKLAMISAFFSKNSELNSMSHTWKERRKKNNEDRQQQRRYAVIKKARE